jgi:hypothetical protein
MRLDTAQSHADKNPTHQVVVRYQLGSKDVIQPRRKDQPICTFCGGEVDCTPGNYMVAFGQGNGPRKGSKHYLCGPCANWVF